MPKKLQNMEAAPTLVLEHLMLITSNPLFVYLQTQTAP